MSFKHFIFTLFTIFALTNCAQDDNKDIIGEWQLVAVSGGIAGSTEIVTAENRLEITATSIKQYSNGDLVSEQGYILEVRTSRILKSQQDMILYDNSYQQMISINRNELIISDDYVDGYEFSYRRK